MTEKIYDIAIIGGGPTGLFGLFYTCIREMDAVLIDSLAELGGQLTALYPEKDVYDMPGYPKVLAKDLVEAFVQQATMHRKQDILLNERVETCERNEGKKCLTLRTTSGKIIDTKTVVITTGAGAFTPNKLPVPHMAQYEGKYIHYSVRDTSIFRDKRLVVVGGGDSAFDWIMNLHKVASSITMVHRRDGFRAHEDSIAKVMAMEDVPKYLFWEVRDATFGPDGELTGVVIENNQTKERTTLEADVIVANLGFAADAGPVKNWGVEMKGNYIHVNQRMETNIPGIYAAGDVAFFEGKLKLIATGVGEAAVAVNAAKHYIDPTQREQPVHSTTLFEKKKHAAAAGG